MGSNEQCSLGCYLWRARVLLIRKVNKSKCAEHLHMTKTIIIAFMLFGTTVANAADYSWTGSASLVNGSPANCGSAPYSDYKVAIKGNTVYRVA
jgi:hypothetical protein